MATVIIILLILCSPIVLGPIIVPLSWRATEKRWLKKLRAYVDENIEDGYLTFESRAWLKDRCKETVYVSCTERSCDGPVYDVLEHSIAPMKTSADEGGYREVEISIGLLCPRCGHFDNSESGSKVLGRRYRYIHSAEQIVSALKTRQRLHKFSVAPKTC